MAPFQPTAQGLALEQFTDQEGGAVLAPEVVDGHVLGWESAATALASRSKRARLPVALRDSGRQDLEGDVALELGVAGAVDLPMPPRRWPDDLVVTKTGAGFEIHEGPTF